MKIIIGSRKKAVKSGLVLISGSWGSKIMAFGEEHGSDCLSRSSESGLIVEEATAQRGSV